MGDLALGTPEPEAAPQPAFSVYPNPATGDVTVRYALPSSTTKGFVLVTDALGRKMSSQQLPGPIGQILLDTRSWDTGMYTVACIVDGRVVQTEKLIVP